MIQTHLFYSGIVQGVGFRYVTQRLANKFNLSGWVKNLADGRVEILAEGLKEDIENFCAQLEEHFGRNIRDKKEDSQPIERRRFEGFQIAY